MALSVSEAVGDAAKAAVDALGLLKPGSTTATVPCVKRKTPSVPEGNAHGLPEIVVSVQEESYRSFDFRTDRIVYRVTVTIVTAGGQKMADDPVIRDWRQQIRRAVADRLTWADVAGWLNTDPKAGETFDPAALAKDYNYSQQIFTVETLEQRSFGGG